MLTFGMIICAAAVIALAAVGIVSFGSVAIGMLKGLNHKLS